MFSLINMIDGIDGRIRFLGRFKTIESCKNFIQKYDSEGTLKLSVFDTESLRYLTVEELWGRQTKLVEYVSEWKTDGF